MYEGCVRDNNTMQRFTASWIEERETSSFPVTSHAERQSDTGTTGQKKGQSIRGITTIIEKQDYTLHLLSVLLCLWC